MALRSRAPAARPMERVEELRTSRARPALQGTAAARSAARGSRGPSETARGEARRQALRIQPEELAEIASFREQASPHPAAAARRRARIPARHRRARRPAGAVNIWLPPIFAAVLGVGVFIWRSSAAERGASEHERDCGRKAAGAWSSWMVTAAALRRCLLRRPSCRRRGAPTRVEVGEKVLPDFAGQRRQGPARHGDDVGGEPITSSAMAMRGCWRRRAPIPSTPERIAELTSALSAITYRRPMTRDDEKFDRIGLGDPLQGGTGALLEVGDGSGHDFHQAACRLSRRPLLCADAGRSAGLGGAG